MLNNQLAKLTTILEDKDLQQYSGDAFWNLIQSVIIGDSFAGIEAAGDIKKIIFHMPTLIFWDKMKRYLLGTYRCFSDQVKMSEKFNFDHAEYNMFVKRQIHLIDELNDDLKVDFFAALTRCFLLTNLNRDLYFKLAKLLSVCTYMELEFLKSINIDFSSKNTTMISLLYQNGLFEQKERDDGGITYVLSDLAKALKQNSLNFDEGLSGENRLVSLEQLTPLSIAEPTMWQEIDEILNN